jgi:hypothetical protein
MKIREIPNEVGFKGVPGRSIVTQQLLLLSLIRAYRKRAIGIVLYPDRAIARYRGPSATQASAVAVVVQCNRVIETKRNTFAEPAIE